MRFRDLVQDINRHEQKIENVLLYVDFMDHELPVILLKDGLLLTACYLDLFELLREEMPTETAIMRVSRQETSSYFNPLLPGDPLMQVPEDQFEFCMGLLKLIAGPKLATPANEMAMRKRLAEFFNAHEKVHFFERLERTSDRLAASDVIGTSRTAFWRHNDRLAWRRAANHATVFHAALSRPTPALEGVMSR